MEKLRNWAGLIYICSDGIRVLILSGQIFPDYFVDLLICTNYKTNFVGRNLKAQN